MTKHYTARNAQQILDDVADNGPLRWEPIADSFERRLMMGDQLISQETEDGIATWLLIDELLQGDKLRAVEHSSDSVCEYFLVPKENGCVRIQ